jgi:hypothetical protein
MTQHYIPRYQNSLLHLCENITILTASVYQFTVTTSEEPVSQFATPNKPPLCGLILLAVEITIL